MSLVAPKQILAYTNSFKTNRELICVKGISASAFGTLSFLTRGKLTRLPILISLVESPREPNVIHLDFITS